MLRCVTSLVMKPPRPALVRPLAAALLLLAGAAAFAQEGDDTLVADTDLQVLPSDTLDHAVWATLLPDNDAADPTVVRSAISAVLAARDVRPRSIVPITARKDKPVVVQVRIDPNA